MSNILIDVAAEFTGKKAFDKAGSSVNKLEKNVKSLGRTLGVTLSAAAVLAYGKASVKAAAADKKAQQQLAIALKNVGLGRDAATAEGYIQRLEKEFGVIDEQLRPAYSRLAIATRDTTETQRLLGIALDISASTGKDLDSVTAALSKAYLGNNTALSKLGIGIAKADLKTKSFKEITDQLAVTFAGSAKASADSFAGSMDKLAIASNNAKEIIGTSLIGALQSLGNNTNMASFATDIESAAKSLANLIDSIVYLKGEIASIPGAGLLGYLGSGVTDLLGRFSPQRLAELIKAIKGFQGMGNVSMTGGSNMDTQKADAAAKLAANKAAAAKIKADKAAAAAKIKADNLVASNAAKLAKAGSIFDLDKIQIEAALKGKISEEEKTRLLLMQAIADEDATKAEKLQQKLEDIQKKNEEIAKSLTEISTVTDPFAAWADSLGAAATILGSMPALINASGGLTGRGLHNIPQEDLTGFVADVVDTVITEASGSTTNSFGWSLPSYLADQTRNSPFQPTPVVDMPSTNKEPIPVVVEPIPTPATNNPFGGLGGNTGGFGFSLPSYLQGPIPQSQPAPVTVNVTGSVIMQDELVKVVNDAVVAANTNGYNNYRPGAVLP
jgi:hypothetical protein